MYISLAWEEDFPKGYGHTSIAFLKRCIGFRDAKNGDLDAAKFVVAKCVKKNRISELKEKYPCAILLPVLSNNQLPLALAEAIGLPIWKNVRLIHTVSRKLLNAIQRMLHRPIFVGYIEKGVDYILVDDVITQGGTISTLRKFVIVHGGKVVAVVALAYSIGSHSISPTKNHLFRMMLKFGEALNHLLIVLGIAKSIKELTNSQAKYLLRFSSVGNIRRKLSQLSAA